MSLALFVSPGTRLDESEVKATSFPSDVTDAGAWGAGEKESAPCWLEPVA